MKKPVSTILSKVVSFYKSEKPSLKENARNIRRASSQCLPPIRPFGIRHNHLYVYHEKMNAVGRFKITVPQETKQHCLYDWGTNTFHTVEDWQQSRARMCVDRELSL